MADSSSLDQKIDNAVRALRAGGVIAYPTEYCFGLGCDPRQPSAVRKLLKIKQRQKEQGVILVAAKLTQVRDYAMLDSLPKSEEIIASWPGPNTWVLPVDDSVSTWLRGRHTSIAMRVSDHPVCQQLCLEFDHAIVSTSANRHGQDALLTHASVTDEFGSELDFVIDAKVGGAKSASTIRDAVTGQKLR